MRWKQQVAAAVLLLAVLTGCSSQPTGDAGGSGDFPTQTVGPAADVQAVESFSLAYNTNDGLDPLACTSAENQMVAQLCFERLFVLNAKFEPQKVLCDSLEKTGDKSYTLTIRSGVKFHSGQEVTPADVVYSLNNARLRDDSNYQDQLACISSVKYNGDEIRIRLYQEKSNLAALLNVPIFRQGTEEDECPDGSGPYQLVKTGSAWNLIPFEQWSGGTVGFCESILLKTVSDSAGAANLMGSRDVSILLQRDAEGVAVQGAKYTVDVPTTTLHYLGINCGQKPLNDAAVRTALSMLLGRDNIAATCFAGRADAASVPINPAPDGVELPTYNKEKALELLKEAGVYDRDGDGYLDYRRGKQFTLDIIYNQNYAVKGVVLEQYAKSLNEVGIATTITPLEFEDCQTKLRRESFQLYYGEYETTADFDLSSLISGGGERNFGGYYDEELENAMAEMEACTSDELEQARQTYLKSFLQQTPIIPIAFERAQILSAEELPKQFDPWPDYIFHGIETWSAS